jgi:hypothetical protein
MTSSHIRSKITLGSVAIALAAALWIGCGREQGGPTAPETEHLNLSRQQDLGRAIAAKESHTDRLLAIPGVMGTAVGLTASGDPAVLIFTKAPGVAGLPQSLGGIPVVVKVTGTLVAHPLRQSRAGAAGRGLVDPRSEFPHPVPIGVSTSNATANTPTFGCATGTIAARVKDASGKVYALSNNHVYALINTAARRSAVVQPGLVDDDCVINGTVFVSDPDGPNDEDDIIGTLASFERLEFCNATCPENLIDAAIARSSTADLGNATPSNGYGTPSSTPVTAFIGQRVEKYGRTTALTTGTVMAMEATVLVDYGGGQIARFIHQIIVGGGGFTDFGDSGALVVAKDGLHPVGLFFALSPSISILNRIGDVMAAFGVTIDGS